jgi:PAS domain S-box-containing protein
VSSEPIPPDALDVETLRDRLRVAERKLALAEAQLVLSAVAPAPAWSPTDEQGRAVAGRLGDVGPALDVLFHTAKATMVLLDGEGRILRANAAAADLWGRPLTELIGMRTVEITAPEDVDDTKDRLAAVQSAHFLTKTYVRGNGSRVSCLALGWPLVDDDGEAVCLIGVAVPLESMGAAPSVVAALTEAVKLSEPSEP